MIITYHYVSPIKVTEDQLTQVQDIDVETYLSMFKSRLYNQCLLLRHFSKTEIRHRHEKPLVI